MAEQIPTWNGCSAGKYCSDQQMTEVGEDKTKIYHRTVTTLTGTGPAYTGSKTETYIVKPAGPLGSFPTWTLAATSTDGGKTQTFTDAAGADLKKSLSPGGNLTKNTQIQTQQTLAKGLGTNASGQTGAVLDKINPEQQKKLNIINPSVASSTEAGTQSVDGGEAVGPTSPTGGYGGALIYPEDLGATSQDRIKFDMLDDKKKIVGTAFLAIPSGISDTNACNWGENSLNAAQQMAAAVAFEGITKGVGAGVEEVGKSLKKVFGEDKSKTGLAAFFAATAVGTDAAALLSRTSGIVLNPNLQLLFNGPTLRPFSFTFKMSARSQSEAKIIITILNFFKRGMSSIKTKSNLFLKAPHTFKIEYRHLGGVHPYIGKIKECALQSITTNYTPEGQYATYVDGYMVSYEIQMQFQELEPIFNNDYESISEIGY